jgi:hypothetical protein
MLIQLYLFLHLQQVESSVSDTQRIAWVALYDNLLARLVTFLTGVLLPVVTCIYVTIVHFSWWNAAFGTFSFLIAIASIRLFWRLPRIARP